MRKAEIVDGGHGRRTPRSIQISHEKTTQFWADQLRSGQCYFVESNLKKDAGIRIGALPKNGNGQIFSVNFFGGAAYRPTPSEKAKALAVPQNSLKVK